MRAVLFGHLLRATPSSASPHASILYINHIVFSRQQDGIVSAFHPRRTVLQGFMLHSTTTPLTSGRRRSAEQSSERSKMSIQHSSNLLHAFAGLLSLSHEFRSSNDEKPECVEDLFSSWPLCILLSNPATISGDAEASCLLSGLCSFSDYELIFPNASLTAL